jgi:endoglycosylceramidase
MTNTKAFYRLQINYFIVSGLLILLTVCSGCKRKSSSQVTASLIESCLINSSQNAISVSGTRFIDSYGRQVLFSGVNKVNKDPKMNYTDIDSTMTFEKLNQWGFNCIRLGVIWDGVEPNPGVYNEKYLDKLEKSVTLASHNGLYVLLDMHQDLYGVSFGEGNTSLGDGAPKWATLTENLPHVKGQIWSESYLISPAVQKAFDNFWANKPASDGIGVQDHYASMWQHVAKRFADNKAVIGFDIMNEPFNGTQGTNLLPLILSEYATLFAEETGKVLSENEVMNIWSDEDTRFEALSRLQSAEKYARIFDKAKNMNQQFEKTALQSMYQKVGNAIREVDTTHILFLEHSYFGNMGISSGIEPVRSRNGNPDPLVAYAGHGYDLLVDTKNYDSQSDSRVELIFSRINETSARINVPVLVGEWGAFSGNSEAVTSSVQFITGLFERFGLSNTYWAYYTGIEKDAYFIHALVRPYPQYIGGKLKEYGFNHETGLFNCSWEESPLIKASTVIYIPDLERLIRDSIKLTPAGNACNIISIKDSKSGYLIIPVTGDSVIRKAEFKLAITDTSISPGDKADM